MVIMSDIQSFGLKFGCLALGLFSILMIVLYVALSSAGPKIVYAEPEVVVETDTVVVHDTVYMVKTEVVTQYLDENGAPIDEAERIGS